MSEDDCLFCRIVSRKTDAVIVYEDEETLTFLDHRPLFPGHCLVIPRQHYETLPDLPPAAVAKFFLIVQLDHDPIGGGIQLRLHQRSHSSVPEPLLVRTELLHAVFFRQVSQASRETIAPEKFFPISRKVLGELWNGAEQASQVTSRNLSAIYGGDH